MPSTQGRIAQFDFTPGKKIAGRYVVQSFIGGGYEGEVYRVVEASTGVTRAAKVFYPHRNERDAAVKRYATKLDRLRNCAAIIQYHHTETLRVQGQRVTCLISEFVEGELFKTLVRKRRFGRLGVYEGLCLLHALTMGIQQIHAAGEYHGDLHDANILIKRRGILFDVRFVDFYDRGPGKRRAQRDDIFDLVYLLYHALGGKEQYRQLPIAVREICKGLRRDLVLKKFPTAARLRNYLETFEWDGG